MGFTFLRGHTPFLKLNGHKQKKTYLGIKTSIAANKKALFHMVCKVFSLLLNITNSI